MEPTASAMLSPSSLITNISFYNTLTSHYIKQNITHYKMNKINEILSSLDGSAFSIIHKIYEVIKESEEKAGLLQHACKSFGIVSSDNTEEFHSPYEELIPEMRRRFNGLMSMFVNSLENSYVSEADFYNTAVFFIFGSNSIYQSDEEKIFALYDFIMNPAVPYYYIPKEGLYSMSNDEFRAIINKSIVELHNARCVKKRTFEQRTQRAAAFLELLGIRRDLYDVDSYNNKIAIMCEILKPEKPNS